MVNRRQVIKSAAAAATVLAMPKYASASSASASNGFLPAGQWVPANQSLSLIYPLTDAVTNANARHHWAYYDGTNAVLYQIPIVAMGGAYPYVFTLDSGSAALGMTIGQGFGSTNYGVLTWQPTGTVTSHTVTVTITDQARITTTAVFTISTSSAAAHFVFLDAAAGSDTSGTGTFSAPWQTLKKAFGTTFSALGSAAASAIVYAKATGTYSSASLLYTDNDINDSDPFFEIGGSTKPSALIGLGGQAEIDWTSGAWALALGNNPL